MSNSEADYLINTGYQQRLTLFRKGADAANDYKESGVKFFGRLYINLISSSTGIIPDTKIQIQLSKNSSAFVLMSQPGNNEQYQIKLEQCYLFIPIAQGQSYKHFMASGISADSFWVGLELPYGEEFDCTAVRYLKYRPKRFYGPIKCLIWLQQVSAPVYTEISTVLAKKSVSMHYRRTELRLVSIPTGKIEFHSDQEPI